MAINEIRNPFIRKLFLVFWAPFVILIVLAIGVAGGLLNGIYTGVLAALEDWINTCNFMTGELLRMIRRAWRGHC